VGAGPGLLGRQAQHNTTPITHLQLLLTCGGSKEKATFCCSFSVSPGVLFACS